MRRAFSFPPPLRPAAAAAVLALCLVLACAAGGPGEARWVSLAPSATEVLFAVGAGPEVAGVCAPADWPPEAAGRKVVASWERVDVEAVVAVRPRACFTVEGMNPPEAVATLRRLGIPVHVFPARSLGDVPAMLEAAGRLTGRREKGAEAARRFREEVSLLTSGLSKERIPAAVVVGLDPLVVAGGQSFLNDLLEAAGFENVFVGLTEAYPLVSLEELVRRRPAVLVLPEGEVPEGRAASLRAELEGLQGGPVRAVAVPADLLVRPGPRSLRALEILVRARRGGGTP